MMWNSGAILFWCLGRGANAAFGLSSKGNTYSVDTNANLVFDVSKTTGDITSLLFNGAQYQGSSKMTHLNSGLGSSKVTAETVNGYVKITIVAGSQPVTHYYVAKPNDPTIYMATYITGEINPGELRFLARLRRSAVPSGWHGDVANLDGCTAFEGKDTFKCPNGQTRCKMYTSDRFIDDQVHGVTGKNAGIWMIMPGTAYETSSGGPFMRDINTQSGDDQELYWYMNSGHVRTEPWRFGLHGPYAMTFTNGSQPSPNFSTSFFSSLSIQGYTPSSSRGTVSGFATGIPSSFQPVLHWHNPTAQYWTYASPSTGEYTSPLMKPGNYNVTFYRNEFPIAYSTVTITSGISIRQNISSTEPKPSVVWRIGEFDGQPFELKNGDKFLRAHPEDVRMSSWGGNYTMGKSSVKEFPMALFAKAGGPAEVKFELTGEQARSENVLRVGTTLSFKGGRPSVKMGGWTGKDPGAPKLIDSRGVTRGAYRGYGEVYNWKIPAGTMKEGSNTLTMGVFGSGDAKFLSANYIVDAVELQGPAGPHSPKD